MCKWLTIQRTSAVMSVKNVSYLVLGVKLDLEEL